MTRNVDPKHHRRKEAVEEALEVLGPQGRSILLFYLYRQKKIIIGSDYCSPIEEIKASLEALFGDGADNAFNRSKREFKLNSK